MYWDKSRYKEAGFRVKNTDQRFSSLDHKILRSDAEQIINNKVHFDSVKNDMPNEFYLRQAIRIYIDLLSTAHAEIRSNAKLKVENADKLIKEYLLMADHEYAYATLIKYDNSEAKEEIALSSSIRTLDGMSKVNKAPLCIEYYAGMPGEYRDMPTLDEPIQKKQD